MKKYIKENLANKKSLGMVALDINSAFDKVWHKGLIHKLTNYNFPLYLIKVVANFLKDRKFHVGINSSLSETYTFLAGVPQGTVLEPILYLIFTADIPHIGNAKLSIFADNTAVFTAYNCCNNILINLQVAVDSLQKYF
jgi:hypothetical protein